MGVILFNHDGTIINMNKKSKQILDIDESSIKHWMDIVSQSHIPTNIQLSKSKVKIYPDTKTYSLQFTYNVKNFLSGKVFQIVSVTHTFLELKYSIFQFYEYREYERENIVLQNNLKSNVNNSNSINHNLILNQYQHQQYTTTDSKTTTKYSKSTKSTTKIE
jgi:hypothetical protein